MLLLSLVTVMMTSCSKTPDFKLMAASAEDRNPSKEQIDKYIDQYEILCDMVACDGADTWDKIAEEYSEEDATTAQMFMLQMGFLGSVTEIPGWEDDPSFENGEAGITRDQLKRIARLTSEIPQDASALNGLKNK